MTAIFIQKVEVKNLFGFFDYTIQGDVDNSIINQLLILYGDNGAGKTTIIKLLFYLLSTQDHAGHKSAVANIKFEAVRIYLSNNYIISAKRSHKELIGGYLFAVENCKNAQINEVDLPASNRDSSDCYSIRLTPGEKAYIEYHNIYTL